MDRITHRQGVEGLDRSSANHACGGVRFLAMFGLIVYVLYGDISPKKGEKWGIIQRFKVQGNDKCRCAAIVACKLLMPRLQATSLRAGLDIG
ncbi:MAG: hypothetical protein KAU41_07020 [Deltaproteobacteria bacterium]|nr:hypothetical protein [Deltaproteobacteria bacterium]